MAPLERDPPKFLFDHITDINEDFLTDDEEELFPERLIYNDIDTRDRDTDEEIDINTDELNNYIPEIVLEVIRQWSTYFNSAVPPLVNNHDRKTEDSDDESIETDETDDRETEDNDDESIETDETDDRETEDNDDTETEDSDDKETEDNDDTESEDNDDESIETDETDDRETEDNDDKSIETDETDDRETEDNDDESIETDETDKIHDDDDIFPELHAHIQLRCKACIFQVGFLNRRLADFLIALVGRQTMTSLDIPSGTAISV
ncbi:protein PFC0760c-like [Adelges cooleyi]|uniref:protein PFC0760c-like n=1 Tax=Adelges cooleyi TaxID=133065 RepID=UPI00217F60ED|nr:protein PFC0760c-like [Adelges cooleyi]